MNSTRFQELVLDYIDGSLPAEESAEMAAYIENHPEAQREVDELRAGAQLFAQLPQVKPSSALRAGFHQMLEREKHTRSYEQSGQKSSWLDPFFIRLLPTRPLFQAGFALCLLLTGLVVGQRFAAVAQKPAALGSDKGDSTTRELAALRTQVDAMGKLVTYSIMQQRPTGERLKGVLATLEEKSPDDSVLTDLIGTLALDANVNVRLAALNALAPHADKPLVRAGVRAALARETSPVAQGSMIDFLAAANDHDAIPLFDQISHNENAPDAVREAARRAQNQITPASS